MIAGNLDDRVAVRAGAKRSEADIYRLYAALRSSDPFWRSPWGEVYLSSWELVEQAFSSRALSHSLPLKNGGGETVPNNSTIADWMLFKDGADHAMLRRAFQGPFAAGNSLSSLVTAIVAQEMKGVPLNRPIDAVTGFTRSIPEKVICELMGVSLADIPKFRLWSEEIRTVLDIGMDDLARQSAAAENFTDYFVEKFTRESPSRATAGAFDVSELVAAVGMRAAAANVAFLAFSGHETTVHLLSNMLFLLANEPSVWERVRSTPALAAVFVAEALRLESPVQKICGRATKNIDFAGGHRLHEGETAVLLLGAANRDPKYFPNPDRIDLSRRQAHLAFGKGLHSCLGRGLAALEGEAVLLWLTAHVKSIALEAGGFEWIRNSSFRGLQRVSISLHS